MPQQQRRSSKYNPQDIKVRMGRSGNSSSRPSIGAQGAQIERQFNPNIQDNTANNLARLVGDLSKTYAQYRDVQQPANERVDTKLAAMKGALGLGTEGMGTEEKAAHAMGTGEANASKFYRTIKEAAATIDNPEELKALYDKALNETMGGSIVSNEVFEGAAPNLVKAKLFMEETLIANQAAVTRQQAATNVMELARQGLEEGADMRSLTESLQKQYDSVLSRSQVSEAVVGTIDETLDETLGKAAAMPSANVMPIVGRILKSYDTLKRKDSNGISISVTPAGKVLRSSEKQAFSAVAQHFKARAAASDKGVNDEVAKMLIETKLGIRSTDSLKEGIVAALRTGVKASVIMPAANYLQSEERRSNRQPSDKQQSDEGAFDVLHNKLIGMGSNELTTTQLESAKNDLDYLRDNNLITHNDWKMFNSRVGSLYATRDKAADAAETRKLKGDLKEDAEEIKSKLKLTKSLVANDLKTFTSRMTSTLADLIGEDNLDNSDVASAIEKLGMERAKELSDALAVAESNPSLAELERIRESLKPSYNTALQSFSQQSLQWKAINGSTEEKTEATKQLRELEYKMDMERIEKFNEGLKNTNDKQQRTTVTAPGTGDTTGGTTVTTDQQRLRDIRSAQDSSINYIFGD